jgi:hypothetical protein
MDWVSIWVIAADLIVAGTVLFRLITKWIALNSLSKAIPNESGELPEDHAFGPAASDLGRSARGFFAEMRTFHNANALSQFDVRRQMESLALKLRSFSATARAVAGILILTALLVTLFNLQNAVSNLSSTFRDIAETSRVNTTGQAVDLVSSVQNSMSRVAQAASEAFRLSAVAIFMALVLLSTSLLAQRHANHTFGRFSAWAWRVYNTLVARGLKRTAAEDHADFSGAISEFKNVVHAFEELSKDLTTIAGFREEMKDATTAIRDAVEKLPATINTSMGAVSTTVAKEIGNNLEKHYSVLMKVLATYGDQETRYKELNAFTKTVLQQNKAASDALASLQGLPKALETLVASVSAHANDTSRLTVAAGQLDDKVSKLPVLEISHSVRDLQVAGTGLNALVADSKAIQEQWKIFLNGWREALRAEQSDIIKDIAGRLSQVSSKLENLRALESIGPTLSSGFEKQAEAAKAIESSISAVSIHMIRLRDEIGAPAQRMELSEILTRLEDLDKDVNKSIWQRLRGK